MMTAPEQISRWDGGRYWGFWNLKMAGTGLHYPRIEQSMQINLRCEWICRKIETIVDGHDVIMKFSVEHIECQLNDHIYRNRYIVVTIHVGKVHIRVVR